MGECVVNFEGERVSRYLHEVFDGYLNDPADTDWQRAYLAAHLDLYREFLGKGLDDDRLKLLDAQVSE
jgi:hypothetical protein